MTMSASVALAVVTTLTTLGSVITFICLFSRTVNAAVYSINNGSSGSADGNGDDDDDGHWYDRENFDFKREEQAALKQSLNVLLLGMSCATLFVPIAKVWHPTKGAVDRFHVGVLAAALFSVANILFVAFWSSTNFMGGGDGEDGNDNNNDNRRLDGDNYEGNNNYDDDYEMEGEELLAYHQRQVSTSSLVLASAFTVLSMWSCATGRTLPETTERCRGSDEPSTPSAYAQAKKAAYRDILSEAWRWLSACTIVIFALLFVVAGAMLLGEDAERRREEGDGNLAIVLSWVLISSTFLFMFGRKVVGETKLGGTLGMGMFFGGAGYYALLLFVVFALYFNVEFRREDVAGVMVSFACLFLSLMHLAVSRGMCKFRDSFVDGVLSEEDSMGRSYSRRSTGGFQRMEDDELEPGSRVEMT